MQSNPSSVFGLATILVFLTFPVLAQTPAGVPSLDEMAGDWLPMKDVANPPDVNNFHDMLIIGRDLTSFYCNPEDWLWGWGDGKWSAGYPLVTLTIAGKEYPATECRWYPYRALRRNPDCGGLAVETDTRMINEQRAVLVRVQIANPSATKTNVNLALSVSGLLQPDGISVLNTNQRPGFATIVCPATKPDSVTNDNGIIRWQWKVALSAGGKTEMGFIAGDGRAADSQKVQADVMRWRKHFSAEFDGFKQCWERRWADVFTPGNHHFSGNLPVLVTDNVALKRNYYMGVVTMLELEGTQFYWDASMQSTVWALLEPVGMKATLRRWLVQNPRSGQVIDLTRTNGFDAKVHDRITGYAFNACTIFKTALDYLRITGDLTFLDEKLADGKSVLERMDEIATDWQTLVLPDSPLANYGENGNL